MGLLKFYRSFLNEWLAIEDNPFPKISYYSPDGKKFFQLFREGFGNEHLTVSNPHNEGWKAQITLGADVLKLKIEGKRGEPIFRLAKCPGSYVEMIPFPYTRVINGLYRLEDGQMICWTGFKYYPDLMTSRVYVGTPSFLMEGHIKSVENGMFETSLGVLDTRYQTWEGYPITTVDRREWDINETALGLLLVKK